MSISNLKTSQKSGLILLLMLFSTALMVNLFSPYSIDGQNLANNLATPDATHWLGTDQFGRDMLTRIASAITLSFSLSIICVLTSSVLGVLLGVIAASLGNRFEQVVDIWVNILLALPGLVLILLLAAIAPGSFTMLYLAIALTQWVEYYRVSKAISRTLVNSPQVQLSSMMGFGQWYIFKRHIWPKLSGAIFTMSAFGAANAILTMASLGFIAVGIQPPLAELGLMSVELFPFYTDAPWVLLQPLLVIALLVLGFHLLAGVKRATTD